MEKLLSVFKALSGRNRMRVVSALLEYDELCACQVTELLQVTGATASRHMGVLLSSKLVESRKQGKWVYYRIPREKNEYLPLIDWIREELGEESVTETDRKRLEEITCCKPNV